LGSAFRPNHFAIGEQSSLSDREMWMFGYPKGGVRRRGLADEFAPDKTRRPPSRTNAHNAMGCPSLPTKVGIVFCQARF
jgi:hypothetical protein